MQHDDDQTTAEGFSPRSCALGRYMRRMRLAQGLTLGEVAFRSMWSVPALEGIEEVVSRRMSKLHWREWVLSVWPKATEAELDQQLLQLADLERLSALEADARAQEAARDARNFSDKLREAWGK